MIPPSSFAVSFLLTLVLAQTSTAQNATCPPCNCTVEARSMEYSATSEGGGGSGAPAPAVHNEDYFLDELNRNRRSTVGASYGTPSYQNAAANYGPSSYGSPYAAPSYGPSYAPSYGGPAYAPAYHPHVASDWWYQLSAPSKLLYNSDLGYQANVALRQQFAQYGPPTTYTAGYPAKDDGHYAKSSDGGKYGKPYEN